MTRKLIYTYVAYKMAFNDKLFAAVKETTSKEHFIETAMEAPLAKISPELRKKLEELFVRRFGLSKHPSIFYKPRTVRQWLHDLFALYTTEDILTALSQHSGMREDLLKRSTIGQILDRPFLIELVEKFEEATGKTLLAGDDLSYLDDDKYTYLQMAQFFAKP